MCPPSAKSQERLSIPVSSTKCRNGGSIILLPPREKSGSALQLLSEIVADGNSEFCDDALEMAAANGRADVDSLRQCYYMIAKKEYRPDPLKPSGAPLLNYNPNLSAYDGLMGGEAHG